MNGYQIIELENGQEMILTPSGRAISPVLIEIYSELHSQNPKAAEHWLGLGEQYVLWGHSFEEA